MSPPFSRTRFVQAALALAGALLLDPKAALGRVRAPTLVRMSVRNVGKRYPSDRRLFATVSPGVKGRDRASIRFALDRAATVRLDAVRVLRGRTVVWSTEQRLPAGDNRIWWKPDPKLLVGSYVMRLTVQDEAGNGRVYGSRRPSRPSRAIAPVVRVLGVEAAFERRSYAPGEPVELTVTADCERLTLDTSRPLDALVDEGRIAACEIAKGNNKRVVPGFKVVSDETTDDEAA